MSVTIEQCRLHHKQRQASQAQELEQKRQRILANINTVGRIAQQFGAENIVIFGSALNEKRFHERSDLDILVCGMPLSGWLPALLAMEQIPALFDVVIDLKRAEELPQGLVEFIVKNGARISPSLKL